MFVLEKLLKTDSLKYLIFFERVDLILAHVVFVRLWR